MKSVVAIIGFFALTAYPASFAVGAENDRVEIRVSDADSKAPLGSVLAVGRQFYFTPGAFHHGPDPVCFREDAASSNQDGRIEMRLPQLAEIPALAPRIDDGSTFFPYTEVLLYRPGYCAQRRRIPNRDPSNLASRSIAVELRRSEDSVERRLQYLSQVLDRWQASCGAGDSRHSESSLAMLAEMDTIKRTPYETFLADKARYALDPSNQKPWIPVQIVRVPSDAEVTFTERAVNIGYHAPPFGGIPRKVQYVLRCRSGGDPCDVNLRDEQGRTPLMQAAEAPDIAFMSDLLAQGADPYIEVTPGGDTVLDQLVLAALRQRFTLDDKKLNGCLDAIRLLSRLPRISISATVSSKLKIANEDASRLPSSRIARVLSRLNAELSGISIRDAPKFTCVGF